MSDARHLPALAPMIGRWSVEMSTTGENGETRAQGLTAEKRWFADGRYLEEDLCGAFGGAAHAKRTLLAYNATRGRFEYVSADNHDGVLLLYCSRPVAPDAAPIELWTDYVSPGDAAPRGVLVTVRTEIEVVGPDEHRLRNFYAEPGKPERPFLQYVYRRME